jgi:hypothetical protein
MTGSHELIVLFANIQISVSYQTHSRDLMWAGYVELLKFERGRSRLGKSPVKILLTKRTRSNNVTSHSLTNCAIGDKDVHADLGDLAGPRLATRDPICRAGRIQEPPLAYRGLLQVHV